MWMESKGSFTLNSNEQMHRWHLGWNQPIGREQRHPCFPRGFSHILTFVLNLLLIPQVSMVESCSGLVRVLFSRQ